MQKGGSLTPSSAASALLFLLVLFRFVGIESRPQQIVQQVAERGCQGRSRLAFGSMRLSAVPFQRGVDFRIAELSVDLRTVERVAVFCKHDSLHVGSASAHPELRSDTFAAQGRRQFLPVAAAGDGIAQGMVDFIFRFVRFAQPVLLDLLLARCKVEPVAGGQLLAEPLRTIAVVSVGNRPSVVAHAVEENMQVGMFPVAVADNDKLCILDPHPVQILHRNGE